MSTRLPREAQLGQRVAEHRAEHEVADRHGERDDDRVEEEPREVQLVEQPLVVVERRRRRAARSADWRRNSACGLNEPRTIQRNGADHERRGRRSGRRRARSAARRSAGARAGARGSGRAGRGPGGSRRSSTALLTPPTAGTGTGGTRRSRRSRTARRRSPPRSPGGRTAKPCWYMYIETDRVRSSGPPSVITNGSSNSWR